jgi:hypothetical protein
LILQLFFPVKKSIKVNGLYKVDKREIILHNKNFSSENLMIYTAIHEYAHHLHSCKNGGHLSSRAHTQEFWSIFHSLLEKAEEKKLYTNVYKESAELSGLTKKIQEEYIKKNGFLFMELGRQLLLARKLCENEGLRYEDYIDRILCIPRLAATIAIKSFQYNLNPALGADNMRYVSTIKNDDDRESAESALLSGKSPDSVKIALRCRETEEDPRKKLTKEKERIERTIETLSKRLKQVDKELESI